MYVRCVCEEDHGWPSLRSRAVLVLTDLERGGRSLAETSRLSGHTFWLGVILLTSKGTVGRQAGRYLPTPCPSPRARAHARAQDGRGDSVHVGLRRLARADDRIRPDYVSE